MNTQKIIEFVKVNGGATVALFLSFIYINRLETRLDKVEQRLYNCYTQKYAVSEFDSCKLRIHSQILAILPKEIKICKDEKKKVS